MKTLLERIAEGEILISDGAMGTFLHAKGLTAGRVSGILVCFPRRCRAGIANAYVAAGADIVETNSFGGNSFKLKAYGLEGQSRVQPGRGQACQRKRSPARDMSPRRSAPPGRSWRKKAAR